MYAAVLDAILLLITVLVGFFRYSSKVKALSNALKRPVGKQLQPMNLQLKLYKMLIYVLEERLRMAIGAILTISSFKSFMKQNQMILTLPKKTRKATQFQ